MSAATDRAAASPKPVVVVLDVHSPAVQAIISAAAPPDVDLRTATSTEPAAQRALAADADVFIGGVTAIPADVIDAAPRLRLIQKWGIGVDKIDLDAARRRGIPVAITAGANARPVAEHTLLLMLAVLKRLGRAQAGLRAGRWWEERAATRVDSFQLAGKVVGLVGLGNIGRRVARRVRAFEAEVVYYDVRRPTPDEERELGVTYRPFDDLLAEADVVSLHIPYQPSTRGILSRERIARLKPDAVVINTARGELIDEAALAEALRAGRLRGVGVDVFGGEPPGPDNPLLALDLPNLVVTPHIAGSAYDNIDTMAAHVFANVRRVLTGEPIPEQDVVVAVASATPVPAT